VTGNNKVWRFSFTDNAIYVHESGTDRGTFGAYAVRDKLRVSIVSGVVKYSKNGTCLLHQHGAAGISIESGRGAI
jgi:hypothetical protein